MNDATRPAAPPFQVDVLGRAILVADAVTLEALARALDEGGHQRAPDADVALLRAENLLLRQLLWTWHGCPYGTQYGDDGELQCAGRIGEPHAHGPIDFRRDTAERIQEALQAPSLHFIQEHQDDRCRHCGVGRWTFDSVKPCSNGTHEWVTG